MSIIGIIANEKQTNQIKKEIQKEDLKVELICLNSKSIKNIRRVKFDILVIQDSSEKLKENERYIKEILKNSKYLLLNTDIDINENIFEDINIQIVTYGLKQKSTITMSGIGEKQIIISIQRAFKDLKGNIIEQQEIPVKMMSNGTKDLYNILIKTTIMNMLSAEER